MNINTESKDRVYDTLVLSGGGIKGFVLLGAIQALKDLNLLSSINTFLGTSIGAIISYLLAIGYTPIEIVIAIYTNKWLEKIQHYNVISMINGTGAANITQLMEALEKLTLNKIGKFITLSKLKEEYGKTLICCTYNMTTCRSEYLSYENYPDLPCLTALRMSANIPLVFDRFKYMDNYYVDGGIADNFPIKKAMELSNNIIGIYLDIGEKTLQDNPEEGIMAYILKLLQIAFIQSTKHRIDFVKNQENVKLICLYTKTINSGLQLDIDSRSRLDMFSIGYNQTKENFITSENKE